MKFIYRNLKYYIYGTTFKENDDFHIKKISQINAVMVLLRDSIPSKDLGCPEKFRPTSHAAKKNTRRLVEFSLIVSRYYLSIFWINFNAYTGKQGKLNLDFFHS